MSGFRIRLDQLGWYCEPLVHSISDERFFSWVTKFNEEVVRTDVRIKSKIMVETSAATDISTQKPIVKYSLLQKNLSIPVLFTAVTDPVAAGLVKTMDKPETNLTGTTDIAPVAEQIKLIQDIKPSVKNVGVIYNTGEVNSVVQVDLVKEAAQQLGLNIVEAVATNTSEVDQAAKSLVGKVDAIYIPSDNVVVTALEAVIQVAQKNKILLVSTEKDSVYRGMVATIGLDYYKLGRQTAEMALKILSGKAKPQEMPVESRSQKDVIINLKAAKALDYHTSELAGLSRRDSRIIFGGRASIEVPAQFTC
ncbi:MAG: putative tryptophan/tyrosine transport system substrate-binding protein [Thermoanaerobacterium sp.]|nr:putative tryptophan/tyrosine transport system substrate-binding protein [Thermoanaerobacterium sp.]MDK2905068.1 putative tryptophan/tyrosine transport system substrate-binding protein [Eubacteriaceae bacterium]